MPSGPDEYIVGLLNEYRASWALIRQWAGLDAAIAQREAEIQKLERLVWDAIYALQKAGLDREAATLRRAIEMR
jgi:putative hemolysin